ncbi:site-specific integrase [Bosea sp. CS1GBMeth4]|uniref:tyrosine-type recombinase/integrase n=1 Tax=Bosea sp. CS1GBMeth4 TaxID=1892849 RepID=UPI0016484717|nr:site-specific integrase [Bosea sp. CS1GBMeth4]
MEQTAFDFSWAEPAEATPDSANEVHSIAPPRRAATIADIHACIAEDNSLAEGRRRDILSGLNRFGAIAGRSLAEIPATAAAVRAVFADAKPAKLGLKKKSLQTLRSSVAFALKRFAPVGPKGVSAVKQNWNPEWVALIGQIQIPFQRHGLSRFAEFCSHRMMSPPEVKPETLVDFLAALAESEVVKNPKDIVHNTISSWNRAARETPGWPQTRLSSPTKPTSYVLPLSALPAGFQSDLAAWEKRVSAKPKAASIFSGEGLLRPLRPETIKSQLFMFRQVATALVKSGAMKLDEIEGLASLCNSDKLLIALEFEYERLGKKERRVLEIASKLRVLAKHFAQLTPEQAAGFDRLCSNRPKRQNQITEKNRHRLAQFDDDKNYRLLTTMPARAAAQARKMKNPYRAAKRMEQAVAVSLLVHVALRVSTLRKLQLDWLKWQPDNSFILSIPPAAMKGNQALELALNAGVGELIREHLERHRPALPSSDGVYLFPGEKGGPRSKNAMYEQIVAAAADAGLEINPHLFRHLLQKVCAEIDPASIADVSRVLGHASPSTTATFYAERNGKAASRRLDQILAKKSDRGEGGEE